MSTIDASTIQAIGRRLRDIPRKQRHLPVVPKESGFMPAAVIRLTGRHATIPGVFDYTLQTWDAGEGNFIDATQLVGEEQQPITGKAYELTGVRTVKLASLQVLTPGARVVMIESEVEVPYPTFDAPEKWVYAKRTAASSIDTHIWAYTFSEHELDAQTTTGPTWRAVSGGLTGTAYNAAEPFNSASGLQGSGVDLSQSNNLSVLPIGTRIVKVYERYDCNAERVFLFGANNNWWEECES